MRKRTHWYVVVGGIGMVVAGVTAGLITTGLGATDATDATGTKSTNSDVIASRDGATAQRAGGPKAGVSDWRNFQLTGVAPIGDCDDGDYTFVNGVASAGAGQLAIDERVDRPTADLTGDGRAETVIALTCGKAGAGQMALVAATGSGDGVTAASAGTVVTVDPGEDGADGIASYQLKRSSVDGGQTFRTTVEVRQTGGGQTSYGWDGTRQAFVPVGG